MCVTVLSGCSSGSYKFGREVIETSNRSELTRIFNSGMNTWTFCHSMFQQAKLSSDASSRAEDYNDFIDGCEAGLKDIGIK